MSAARIWLAAALAVAAISVAPDAVAQPAAAVGTPLPSGDLPRGTVTVFVVAGGPQSPVADSVVTLTVNGTPRQARTDAGGHALFKDLPSGATVQAKITDAGNKDVTSESFNVPDSGGMKLMLTTRPWTGAGGGAPVAAGGRGGMPEPRKISGQARGEQSNSPGSIGVTVVYDELKDPAVGAKVFLVGYKSDDTVTIAALDTDAHGRVDFTDLDSTGSTSYFAMTKLPRGGGIDRLFSNPAVLDAQLGVVMFLSSDKRDAASPPIDDLTKLEHQDETLPAGKVAVTLEVVPETTAKVHLYDAASHKELASSAALLSPPDPRDVEAEAQFEAEQSFPAGVVEIQLHGGPVGKNEPIPNIEVRIMPADSTDANAGVVATTAADGWVHMEVHKAAKQKALLTINGKPLISNPFDVSKIGGRLDVVAQWPSRGKYETSFDVPNPPAVMYAESVNRGQLFRSLPFQPVDAHGTHASIYVYPRSLFTFRLDANFDDAFLGVRGQFEVSNTSWSPYSGGPEGIVIPLPKGFKGAAINEKDQAEVAIDADKGFKIVRPIPPGGRPFNAGFSLPVENGAVSWELDLPLGSYQSQLAVLSTPGLELTLPPGVKSKDVKQGTMSFKVIAPITILPKRSMSMTIRGLPSAAAWTRWVPRIVGVLAVSAMLAGLWFAMKRRPGEGDEDPARAAAKRKLLDELVELERTGGDMARRAALKSQLEELWD